MHIKGFQGTSLLDFPGRIAALLFTGGCNLTCPFCHNPGLVLDPGQYPDYPEETLLEELTNRRNFIDGVVISGGEPTLEPGLLPFLHRLRELELQIKIDTNGLRPDVLTAALEQQLLDFVALDLKTIPQRYPELHSGPVDPALLIDSIALLRDADCELELRTTCVPDWVDHDTIKTLGELVKGAPLWALQQFQGQHALDPDLHDAAPYPPKTIEEFAQIAANYVENVITRGL
ncbi:MAG: anaerobic ribonucleoside-triphosphate reductase activating protein [Desulfuromonas sp.]|nr:MAG: anaerobic ribonucleoside-triphosphate reductase activating protein [Desulfuromonas sp.]